MDDVQSGFLEEKMPSREEMCDWTADTYQRWCQMKVCEQGRILRENQALELHIAGLEAFNKNETEPAPNEGDQITPTKMYSKTKFNKASPEFSPELSQSSSNVKRKKLVKPDQSADSEVEREAKKKKVMKVAKVKNLDKVHGSCKNEHD